MKKRVFSLILVLALVITMLPFQAGAKQGGKLKYLLSRIFYSYEKLCNVYPALEGHRWKTPFYQVKRWSNLIFKKGRMRNSINEVRKLKSINSKSLSESERLIYDLGLDKT